MTSQSLFPTSFSINTAEGKSSTLTIGAVDGAPGATVSISAHAVVNSTALFQGKLLIAQFPSEDDDVVPIASLTNAQFNIEAAESTTLSEESNTLIGRINADERTITGLIDNLDTAITVYAGATGPQGVTGLDGDEGVEGPLGEAGPTGPAGPTGETGPIGVDGPEGEQGDEGAASTVQGATGPRGLRGVAGAAGVQGARGERGATGPVGATGPQGATGPEGAKGGDSSFGGIVSVVMVPAISRGVDIGEPDVDGPGSGRRLRNVYAKSLILDSNTLVFENGAKVSASADGLSLPADTVVGGTPLAAAGLKVAALLQGAAPFPTKNINPETPSVQSEDGKYSIGDFVVVQSGGMTTLFILQQITSDANETLTWIEVSSGVSGATGATGPQGQSDFVVGETGATGPTGPQGDKGAEGDRGATGPKGRTGPVGATGPVGPDGDQGEDGEGGDVGATGPDGEVGSTGPTGPAGLKGAVGNVGATGPIGLRGTVGVAGPRGATGPTGPQGAVGADAQGPTGPTGATGPSGIDGVQGENGDAGDVGAAGAVGEQGATGATGPQGARGPAGATGATGPAGDKGATGVAGAVGPTGEVGPSGTFGDKLIPQKFIAANRALYMYAYAFDSSALHSLTVASADAYDPAYSWIVADSSAAPVVPENGEGWLFENTAAGQKINYYFLDNMPSKFPAMPTTAQMHRAMAYTGVALATPFRAGNLRTFFAAVKLHKVPLSGNKFSDIFLALYSAPGNTINGFANKSGWYRSREVLSTGTFPANYIAGDLLVMYKGTRPDLLTYSGSQTPLGRFSFPAGTHFVELTPGGSTLLAEGGSGFNPNTDIIYRMSVGTNSAATVNSMAVEVLEGGYVFGDAAFSVQLR